MKLTRLILKNFRTYKDATFNFIDNFSMIIGKNDSGKSTIFDALDTFFNNNKLSISDLNSTAETKEIVISCCFSIEDDYLIKIDENVKTSPKKEFLFNENNEIQIVCKYDFTSSISSSPDIYLRCYYFNKYKDNPLISMKIKELKDELNKLPSNIIAETDKTTSSEIRLAIYKYILDNDEDPEMSLQDVSIKAEDCKKIYQNLKQDLPLFTILKVDRENSTSDTEIQNPLKLAVQNILRDPEINSTLTSLSEKIEKKLSEDIDGAFSVLKHFYPGQFENLKANISTNWEKAVLNEIKDEDDISLNRHGSGIRRLLVLSYLMYQSNKQKETEHRLNIILALEEPETSLHPDLQQELFTYLREKAMQSGVQIIISTHIPNFVLYANKNQLLYIEKQGKETCVISDENLKLNSIIETLKILPDFAHKLIICVEGQKDENAYNIINKVPIFNSIIDFKKSDIKFLPLDGSNLINWHEKNLLEKVNIKEFHIYDGDRDDYQKIANKINAENNERKQAFVLNSREIENYIHPKIVEYSFGVDLDKYKDPAIWSIINIPYTIYIEKHGLNEFDKSLLSSSDVKREINGYKTKLCGECMTLMTEEMFKEINVFDELKNLFEKIKKIYNNVY